MKDTAKPTAPIGPGVDLYVHIFHLKADFQCQIQVKYTNAMDSCQPEKHLWPQR